jgi:hypothetical protein
VTRTWRAAAIEVIAVVGAFLGVLAIIHPRGNFALNDDGLYALPTFEFARTGQFHMTMMSPSLRAQILWGALFVKAFGSTYDALRLSSIVSAAITVAMINALLALAPIPRIGRILGTLAFAFYPIYLWTDCTFMTEPHFMCLTVIAVYCYVRALRDESAGFMIGGCVAVAISWWIRQTGLITAFPPIVFLALYRDRLSRRWIRDLAIGTTPVIAFAVVNRFWPDTLVGNAIELQTLTHQWHEATWRLPQITEWAYHCTYFALETTALMFLPLAGALLFRVVRRYSRMEWIFVGILILFIAYGTQKSIREKMPLPHYGAFGEYNMVLAGDIFMNFGLGPPTLDDAFAGGIGYPFALKYGWRVVITIVTDLAAIVFLIAIVLAVLERWREPRQNVLLFMCILFAGAHTASLSISGAYFDRYALTSQWTLGIAAAILIPWQRLGARAIAIVLLCVIVLFDVAAIREYFAWQTARWAAWDKLVRAGVPTKKIEGGAEPFQIYELAYITDIHTRRRIGFGHPKRRYAIWFHEREGYHVIDRIPFSGWFGLHQGQVLTIEKNDLRPEKLGWGQLPE